MLTDLWRWTTSANNNHHRKRKMYATCQPFDFNLVVNPNVLLLFEVTRRTNTARLTSRSSVHEDYTCCHLIYHCRRSSLDSQLSVISRRSLNVSQGLAICIPRAVTTGARCLGFVNLMSLECNGPIIKASARFGIARRQSGT